MEAGFLAAVFALFAIAAAFLLPTLWLGTHRTAYAVAVLLPVAGVLLYAKVGTPAALDLRHRYTQPTLDEAVDALAVRLHTQPGNIEGWVLLGRGRKEQKRYAESVQAFTQALKLAPREPELMVELAEAMTLGDPAHRIGDPALQLLQQAQRIDPRNQRALWFLGISAYQRGHYADAATTWEPLLALAPPDTRAALREQIDGARAKAGLPPLPAETAAATGTALLTVRVDIAPALRAKLAPDDALFVFARAADGPPMPVAVKRIPARDFPQTVALGDDDGPMPTMRLSQQKTVSLQARVSHSGDAMPRAGDFEAAPANATVGAKDPVALTIDRVHP